MAQSWRAGSEPLCDHYTEPEPGSRYLAGMALSLQIIASHESAGREGALAEADQDSDVSSVSWIKLLCLALQIEYPQARREGWQSESDI